MQTPKLVKPVSTGDTHHTRCGPVCFNVDRPTSWSTVQTRLGPWRGSDQRWQRCQTSSPLCRYCCGFHLTDLNKSGLSSVRRSPAPGDPDAVRDSRWRDGQAPWSIAPFHLAQPAGPRSGIDNTQPTDYRPGSKDQRRASICPQVLFAGDKWIAFCPRIGCQIDDL